MSMTLTNSRANRLLLTAITGLAIILAGCGGGGKSGGSIQTRTDNTPNIQMDIPASLTGGTTDTVTESKGIAALAAVDKAGTAEPCAYLGDKDEDHFRNGYKITKLLVSAIATWSCIGDLLIDVSNFVNHDGAIHATDNDLSSPAYKAKDPTHYSVTDESDSQTTVRLYYGYARNNPPRVGDDPQFYVSWSEAGDDVLQGRIVVDARDINLPERKADDPTMLRMDFHYTAETKTVDMFLRFDAGNKWAEGFRIHLVKDMNANPLQKVYVARGLIEMKAQFAPVETITEVPTVRLYTVSNRLGKGAAIADFANVSLPLKLSGGIIDNHLGNYLFTKNDVYYFDEDSNWDWIHKTVPSAEYRGGRNTPAKGGTWIPFDPSLDMIVATLELDSDYFSGDKCASEGDDCTQLLESIFSHHEDFAGQEHNQGADPQDWRSDALANPVYLESVYPNGIDWTNAFDFVFVPSH